MGCHTCWLNYFTMVCLWCGRTVGRAVGWCTVTWLPNFLGWVVYHISLTMVLRCARCARFARESSAISFCHIFWRTTQQRKTAQTWDLARLLIYRYSIISEILSLRHSTVLILVFDDVTVKTTKITFFSNCILLLRCLSRITVPSTSKNNVPKDYLSRQVSWNREKYTKNTGRY